MVCVYCGHLSSNILETRVSKKYNSVRRRRRCRCCGKQFMTYEMPTITKKETTIRMCDDILSDIEEAMVKLHLQVKEKLTGHLFRRKKC